MNITPIEIRQKEFERHFRGYDKDEVNAFLHTLSQAWERLLQENREKTARLEKAEKDIEKVREVESSLFRTLRTAEDTGADIVNKAQQEAKQIQQEAEQKKQEILKEAHHQAERIVAEAHQQVEQLRREAAAAEAHRQQALAQLQTLAQRMLQQVEDSQAGGLPTEETPVEQTVEVTQAEEVTATVEDQDAVEEPPAPADNYSDSENLWPATEEEADQQDAAEPEPYEPAWASEEPPATKQTAPTPLKRRSFFDELD